MSALAIEEIRALSENDVRERFAAWIETQRMNGLQDIKFALSSDGEGTVVDVMRQLMMINQMSDQKQLEPFYG